MNKRLIFPDAIKFFAIFFVTCGHCAQSIAGQSWTNLLRGTEWQIAFLMPLFMMMSGWFLNIEKIRETPILAYVIAKFNRLMIPSITWSLLTCLIYLQYPRILFVTAYWYLCALFVSLCIIAAVSKVIKSNTLCIIVSITFVMLCPFMWYSKINFMLPFVWAGYGAKHLLSSKFRKHTVIFCAIIAIVTSLFWNKDFSIYISPWNILNLSDHDIYIYRFITGFSISTVFIFLFQRFERTSIVEYLAKYGKYTLVIYTSSMLLNRLLNDLLNLINWHNNTYGIIELLSIFATIIIVWTSILFAVLCKKNKYATILFLGD